MSSVERFLNTKEVQKSPYVEEVKTSIRVLDEELNEKERQLFQ